MINLLASNSKQDIMYARRNTQMLRFSVIVIIVILGIALISLGGLFYIKKSQVEYTDQVNRTLTLLKEQELEQTQKNLETISNNIKLTTDVLSREVLFSKLIQQIGAAMPTSTNLTDLTINNTTGGIDLTASASSYYSATQVQVNLADPANKIFDKADIVNIVCNSVNATDVKYPCIINIRARFSPKASFYFITPKEKKS